MRIALFAAALLALAMLSSPEVVRGALATSASALFEATPFVLAGLIAARLLRLPGATAYLGCGCTAGPSARSLPAAAAAWLVFGPPVAIARFAAAVVVARWLDRGRESASCPPGPNVLVELGVLLPPALLAGASMQLCAAIDPARFPPLMSAAAGATIAFATAPCGIGAIAVASAMHARAPVAAAAFLCIAGIIDLRTLARRRNHPTGEQDALAYFLLAFALGVVALRRGDALVHPAMTPLLAICAVAALSGAVAHRHRQAAARRFAPMVMLIGALVAAPAPPYHATETTLADLFPGERLTFTGTLARDGAASALVRYAITCCRADAAPVVIRLDRVPQYGVGSWLRIDGRIESSDGGLRLVAREIRNVVPPSDPFIYR